MKNNPSTFNPNYMDYEDRNEAFKLAIAIITILAAVVVVGWFYIKY